MYKNTKASLGRILFQAQRLSTLIESTGEYPEATKNIQSEQLQQLIDSLGNINIEPTKSEITRIEKSKSDGIVKHKTYNHDFVVEYASVLSDIAIHTTDSSDVGIIARLIDRWFHNKFIDDTYRTMGWKRFRYNIQNFNKWIYTIVIYYAYCYEKQDGSLETFISEFSDWIESQRKDRTLYEQYEMPAKLHFCCKNMNKSYCTTTALILWDMYVDAGFSEMCKKRIVYKEAPNPEGVRNLIQKYAPEIDAEYDGYKDDEALLEQFHMI